MKQFGTLLLAAILGSMITFFAFQWSVEPNSNVKIEHVQGTPINNIGYTTDSNGTLIPLDFTGVAERVTKAVVHIRSTSSERNVQRESNDPWQY